VRKFRKVAGDARDTLATAVTMPPKTVFRLIAAMQKILEISRGLANDQIARGMCSLITKMVACLRLSRESQTGRRQ